MPCNKWATFYSLNIHTCWHKLQYCTALPIAFWVSYRMFFFLVFHSSILCETLSVYEIQSLVPVRFATSRCANFVCFASFCSKSHRVDNPNLKKWSKKYHSAVLHLELYPSFVGPIMNSVTVIDYNIALRTLCFCIVRDETCQYMT